MTTDAADAARAQARDILSQSEYRPSRVPQPFRGVLRQLGRLLRPVIEPVERLIDRIADAIPGGRSTLWTILGLAVLLIAVLVTRYLIRGRTRGEASRRKWSTAEGSESPDELERRAELAEHTGDLERAIRLRFLAGLLRLDLAGVVRFRPSITGREISRKVRSETFDDIASDFDEIVYGRREPAIDDVRASRLGWKHILESAGLKSAGRQ